VVKINNFEIGYRKLLRKIKNIEKVMFVNSNRYLIVKTFSDDNYLITFKREPFYNFGTQFKKQGYKGVGDTINCKELQIAIKNKINKIFTIFPNCVVYSITIEDFLNKSIKWVNKEGKEIRSISIHEYKKEYDLKSR
jgi:hypothetical protein